MELGLFFYGPLSKVLTLNSCLCSEAKGLEKKPKLARITVGRVIVYWFSDDVSCFSVVRLIWISDCFIVDPFLKLMTSAFIYVDYALFCS